MSGVFPPNLFAGARFAVVGLGRNGLPAATALADMGAEIIAWDDDARARGQAAAVGITVANPLDNLTGYRALVLSPGIPHLLPAPHPIAAAARAAAVPILSDAELLFEAVRAAGSRARFAGITGTNGKSTTTALLHHILVHAGIESAAGGNLGPAALALPLLGDHGVYVLEMSSYMLERLARLRFDAAAMLNLSADHIDRHGDLAGYATVKRSIFARQHDEDIAVIAIDDPWTDASRSAARTVRISGHRPADFWSDGTVLRDAVGPIVDLAGAPSLPGRHNAQNAAAAAAMAASLGVSRENIAAAMKSFVGLPHRLEKITEIGGISFINDSKATNADATAPALSTYARVIWLAGGVAKAGGIDSLAPLFSHVAEALLFGQDADALADTLASHGVPYSVLPTLEAAMSVSLERARARCAPVVLLSPACASFDQFSGYDARGERFAALARAQAGLA